MLTESFDTNNVEINATNGQFTIKNPPEALKVTIPLSYE